MRMEEAKVVEHSEIQGGYFLLAMDAPGIAPQVQPGQFVHMKIPHLDTSVLRRPFSVYRTDGPRLFVLYKPVGHGTQVLTGLEAGESVSLIGPLGRGFPQAGPGRMPLIVAGGYGMAALYMVARSQTAKGEAFFGGRSAEDILCVDEFKALGWSVHIATEDGSLGAKGLVTDVLDARLKTGLGDHVPELFACGPNGMLQAVGQRAIAGGWTAWLSMDRNMGCGVGACLTCVQKIKQPDGTWNWKRVCREGPVFECRDILWDS